MPLLLCSSNELIATAQKGWKQPMQRQGGAASAVTAQSGACIDAPIEYFLALCAQL